MMLPEIWESPLGRILTAVLDYARVLLSKVLGALSRLVSWSTPALIHVPFSTVDEVLDAIYSLDSDDTIPADWVQLLCLERPGFGGDLQDPQFTYFLGQETYKRYRNEGMLHDLLASTLLARETLELFRDSPPSSFGLPSSHGLLKEGGYRASEEETSTQEGSSIPPGEREENLKAKAALAYADRAGCIFEREKTSLNYSIAIRSAAYAVRESASATTLVQALALDTMGYIYELKWQRDHILADLSDSIEASKLALGLCPQENEKWPVIADNYAGHLQSRFNETKRQDDIDEAIALSNQTYERAENDHDRARLAANLGAKFQARARGSTAHAAKEQDFDRCVDLMSLSVRLTPPRHPERWLRLRSLSSALFARGKFAHRDQDLVGAITHAKEALAAAGPFSAARERLVTHLSDVLELHYTETENPQLRNLEEINECIRWTREVKILHQHEDHRGDSPEQIYRWNSVLALLSRRIFLKYEQTQDPEVAGEAMRLGELLLGPDGRPLGRIARFQWDAGGETEPLGVTGVAEPEGEIQATKEGGDDGRREPFNPLQPVFRRLPHDDPYLDGTSLNSSEKPPPTAGYSYWLENFPPQAESRASHARRASVSFLVSLTGLVERIQGRPGTRVDVLCGAADGVFDAGSALQNQDSGGTAQWYAEQTQYVLRSLVNSIETEDDVDKIWGWVSSMPSDPSRAPFLRMLASQLARYGRKPSLDSAIALRIQVLSKAVQMSPAMTEPLLRARCLADLAHANNAAFSLTGVQEHFETARAQAREAARLGLVGSAIKRDPRLCLPLIALLLNRYWLAGFMDDMQQCIQMAAETAMSLTSAGESFTDALLILAVALQERSSRTKARLDLEEALLFARTALKSEWLSKRKLIGLLNVIGAVSAVHCQADRESETVNRRIAAGEMACRIADPGDTQTRLVFHNLSLAYRARFQAAQDQSSHASVLDVERAVATERLAIAYSSSLAVNRARLWMSLGETYMARYSAFAKDRDRADAIAAYLEAACPSNSGSPLVRITALTKAARLQASMGRPPDALESFDRAIELFATLTPRDMSQENRQALLSEVSGVPGDAAAAALLALGMSEDGALRAVELLEKGRGLIIGTIIEERSEARQLLRTNAALHQQFRDLQARIAAAGNQEPSRGVLAFYGGTTQQPPEATDEVLRGEMERLLGQIRGIEGMSHFLLTPSREELREISRDGTLVMVFNSTVFDRSFAIISRDGRIGAVELPELTAEEIQRNLNSLRRIRKVKGREYFTRGSALIPVLEWLWMAAVKPILCSMGWHSGTDASQPVSAGDLPRMWWIGVGLLAHFPFHAAGRYGDDARGESAMDLVNSSYVPTIKSLLYARERGPTLPNSAHTRMCFVAVETTPGYPRLDGVEDEARLIQAVLPGTVPPVTLLHPTATQVADHMGHCDILHLACHGKSNLTDPSQSHLVLARTDPDGRGVERPDKLFVTDIMRRASPTRTTTTMTTTTPGGIAFLRACYTADNPALRLSDEVIHLASAFHIAGFSHVLATLWSTRNSSCAAVAEKFYTYLLRGSAEPSHRDVAVAFHRAVKELREDSGTNPLLWASFVHVGA